MTNSCTCGAPAMVCQECVRAFALQWFGAISRHPETGSDCVLCEHGHAVYCPACFIHKTVSYRAVLRRSGTRIGEPAGWT
jgi:hypothetical protein